MKAFSVLGIALQYTLEVLLPILRRANNLRGALKSNATWELVHFSNTTYIRTDRLSDTATHYMCGTLGLLDTLLLKMFNHVNWIQTHPSFLEQ
jgi:hypothetical protein